MDVVVGLIVLAALIIGLLAIPFGLPGTAIILAGVFIYAFHTDFAGAIGPLFLGVLCVLTLVAETADNWLTMLGARHYGASTKSMWLSFVGGLGGALIIGGPLAFVFGPLGPVIGGFAGAFGIVAIYEYNRVGNWPEALRAGWGTFLGRMAGILLKFLIAIAMIAAVAIAIWSS